MNVQHSRCCGIDAYKGSATVGVLVFDATRKREARLKTFATDFGDLQKLRFWLSSQKVAHVAMDSTRTYWKPIWNVLRKHFTLLLPNPYPMHCIPARKADAADAEWIADLMAHGLLKPSFVPPVEFRDPRDWTGIRIQQRVKQVGERNRIQNRIEKILEDKNLKLGTVVSDVLGATGRLILRQSL